MADLTNRQITKGITVWNAGEKSQAVLALWGQLTPAISGILSLLPTYSWKSLQGCQPKVVAERPAQSLGELGDHLSPISEEAVKPEPAHPLLQDSPQPALLQ
ncbi:uncharacterized protein WM277_017732 isoform 1-T19 [Molossus nigricans]